MKGGGNCLCGDGRALSRTEAEREWEHLCDIPGEIQLHEDYDRSIATSHDCDQAHAAAYIAEEQLLLATHKQIVDNLLSDIAQPASGACVSAAKVSAPGGGEIKRCYIVGHGEWDKNWLEVEHEERRRGTLEGKWQTPSINMQQNLTIPLHKKTYIILHTKLGFVLLQNAIAHIIAAAPIPEGAFKEPTINQTYGVSAVRYPCFKQEILIFPTKYGDKMHLKGASSGIYYVKETEAVARVPKNICRSSRIMGGGGISIHHFISQIMRDVTSKRKEEGKDVENVTLYIHILCCLKPST